MLGISFLGAIVAGLYGILHDQITYSISAEYFTKLKFHQFDYANFGLPVRGFVAEVGFLATWWVGFFSGWFLARIAVPIWPLAVALRRSLIGFAIILGFALAAAVAGYVLGIIPSADFSNWDDTCTNLGITDSRAFVRVAYIHNAGYLGGLIGVIVAIIHMRRRKKSDPGISQAN